MKKQIELREQSSSGTEDDRWSDNPQTRKAYWLYDANTKVDRFLGSISDPLMSLRDKCLEVLQEGRHEWWILYAKDMLSPSQCDRGANLLNEIAGIIHEKGFRFHNALLTPREHRNIGSTGYGGILWDEDPDVPVPILVRRLIERGIDPEKLGRAEELTFEEVDKARRLSGMTTIDPQTGRVTKEIDAEAASDSYHFLPGDRREEVKHREEEILEEIKKIADASFADYETTRQILRTLELCSIGQITTPEMDALLKEIEARNSQNHNLNLYENVQELRKLAIAGGHWDHIFTPQEILLREGAEVDEQYEANPYTPLAVQDGREIHEIVRLREGEKIMPVNSGILEYSFPFTFRLEQLDSEGRTVKSPTFLDRDDETAVETDRFKEEFRQRMDFPFSRPEDWFYRPIS